MAILVGDTFADTDATVLSSHTPSGPNAGGTWSGWYIPAFARLHITSNRVRPYNTSAIATTAEYHHSQSLTDGYVEAVARALSAGGHAIIGFRHVGTSVSDGAWDAYTLQLVGSTGVLNLGSVKLGTLGTYTISGFTTGVDYTIRLQIVGSALKAYVDGVERISVTNSSITAGGVVLVQLNSPDGASTGSGVHLDSIVMADASPSTPLRRRPRGLYLR